MKLTKKIKTIGIVGLGLIGGSLAKTIRQAHPTIKIMGMDTEEQAVAVALSEEIIDQSANSLEEMVIEVDVLFLCTPVQTTVKLLDQLGKTACAKKLIVTDVASTKQEVIAAAECLQQKNITFIAGHPMAGSHKSGIIAADPNLFENAFYILVPASENQRDELDLLKQLLIGTRAKFVEMSAVEHDQITGMLSHFPHIIAAMLVNQASDFLSVFPQGRQLAAGGFRDITRIASSDPKMWTDIVMTNPIFLAEQIEQAIRQLTTFKETIYNQEQTKIFDFFEQAKYSRDRLPIHEKGAMQSFYDLFIEVPDRPGVIAEVMQCLSTDSLSITNIRIIENREDLFGVLQLTFKRKQELEIAATKINKELNYVCHEKW